MKQWQMVLIGLCISVPGVCYADYILLNHDVATYLTFGELLLQKKHFYTGLYDTNTPLISYLSAIPVIIHNITRISVPDSFFIFAFALLQGCVWLAWSIAGAHPLFKKPSARLALLIAFSYALFIIPNGQVNFGQREHLFCGMILPYLMLSMNRLAKVAPGSRRQAITAGVLAGIGFAIKPHFTLVFMVSELVLACSLKRVRIWLRAEALAAGVVLCLYYLAMLWFTPEYVQLIPMIAENYEPYSTSYARLLLVLPPLLIVPAAMCAFSFPQDVPGRRGAYLLLGGMLASAAIYMQEKCLYDYHLYPILFFTVLLIAVTTCATHQKRMFYTVLCFYTLYLFIATGYLNTFIFSQQPRRAYLHAFTDAMKPYHSVAMLSTSVLPVFPGVTYLDAQWALDMSYLQYVPAAYKEYRGTYREPAYHSPQQMPGHERYFHERIIQDLQGLPDAIAIDNMFEEQGMEGMQFNILHYFMHDPRFLLILGHYKLADHFDRFSIYRRQN